MHKTLESSFEEAEKDGIEFIRDGDGVWRYADSWIPVPGARDVTLTDRFRPKQIVDVDGKVERIVVDGSSIAGAPELLDWCLTEGTPIEVDGELVEVLVPSDLWAAHDRVPGELISPEHDGNEAEQQVAAAERKCREAELRLEQAAAQRAEVLRRHAGQMTRQEARAITGLSVGRIQQLIRSVEINQHELELLRVFARGPISRRDGLVKLARRLTALPTDPAELTRLVGELEGRGLLQPNRQGKGFELSEIGKQAVYSKAVAISEAD